MGENMIVRKERTNWRDEKLNLFHQRFGYDIPLSNSSFVLLEYDNSKPVAIIDYRMVNDFAYSNALIELSNNKYLDIPYFIVQYRIVNNELEFYIYPINQVAMKYNIDCNKTICEEDFVDFLFRLRKRNTSKEINFPLKEISCLEETWQGEIVSKRHRDWGWNNPALDIDFVLEKENKPLAIIEFKNDRTFSDYEKFSKTTSCQAIKYLCDYCESPVAFFLIIYNYNFTNFKINALNDTAKKFTNDNELVLNQEEYLEFLENIRNGVVCG